MELTTIRIRAARARRLWLALFVAGFACIASAWQSPHAAALLILAGLTLEAAAIVVAWRSDVVAERSVLRRDVRGGVGR